MKKFFLYLTAGLAALIAFSSCNKKEPAEEYPSEAMAKVTHDAVIRAAAKAYAVWEDETVLPEKLSVEGEAITKAGVLELTQPQYQYALAQTLVDIVAGKNDDVIVLGYKPAQYPDRDSYDEKEIPVTDGPALKTGTEDLANFAAVFIEDAKAAGTIPNRVLVERKNGDQLAFSTNRLTVCLLRALAAYDADKTLPKVISTDYLSSASTLKGFAQQFVKILDIWDSTVGTVSADGSHCTDNNSAWQNVHFVPVPWSGGAYADGVDQYDAKYQPYFTIEIDGTTYTSAQTWGIAVRGIVDLITVEGSAKMQENRNPFEHTMGNGGSLKDPIPATIPEDIWGQYPWYESTNDGPAINQSEFTPYLIARCATWFLTRQLALGKIGNYQFFTTDPDAGFVEEGVSGFVSSMRMWLIAARFYKYLLDNNIEENVYDAVKNVKFATDLYGVDVPDIELTTKSVSIPAAGTGVEAKFTAKESWTATASESWIHVEPASGSAAVPVAVITISADPNTGAAREGEVVIKGGNVSGVSIAVSQAEYVAPATASLKTFAEEFVKGLDVWEATVGTVESEGKHLIEKGTAWENVHFIPVGKTGGPYDSHEGNQHDSKYTPWVLHVGDTEYTSAQAWEIAIRGLMDMVTAEGQEFLATMSGRNAPYTLANNKSFESITIATPSDRAKWGNYPWYEADDDITGLLQGGKPVTEVDVNFMVKVCSWHLVRGLVDVPGVNSALGNIGNFQYFGTDVTEQLVLDDYAGYVAPMRELLVLMRIYKYLLDNNINDNVYDAIKSQKFDFDLYGIGVPVATKPTYADFIKEFAKVIDKWDATKGTVSFTRDNKEYKYENVHYVPSNYTISVGATSYNKYQMEEVAMRILLDLASSGNPDFTKEVPDFGAYGEASHSYYEYDDPLKETEAGADLLVNFATRCLSYLATNGEWPNVCGYPRTSDPVLTSYNGYVCIERNLLMLSRFAKAFVEGKVNANNYATYKVSTELWNQEAAPTGTLEDFAREFVKGLEVWENTIGNVDADGIRNQNSQLGQWQDVHFIPIVGNPAGDYYNLGNNQYDYSIYTPWVLNINGVEYSSSQAWEIAIRGLMEMCTAEGQAFLDDMTDRNKAYTLANGKALSEIPIPQTSPDNQWGKFPWYEYDQTVTDNGNEIVQVDLKFIMKVCSWHVVRSFIKNSGNNSPLGMIGNFQEFGNNSGTLMLDNYEGLICPMRELLILMRVYKRILDDKIDASVFSNLEYAAFDFDLYGHQS